MPNTTPPPPTHPDFGTRQPVDPDGPVLKPLLPHLQGNIIKGHGRDHTVQLFLAWDPADLATVRTYLTGMLPRRVTSAETQLAETAFYNKYRVPGSTFCNFFLTAAGYRQLGFAPDMFNACFPETAGAGVASNFKDGMKAHGPADFNDPPPTGNPADPKSAWDEGYRGEVHAMLLLADDDEVGLLRQARELATELTRNAIRIVQAERGDALRNDDDQPIEHFGYVDGRSQPLFLTTDFKLEGGHVVERDTVKGGGRIDQWNPVEPLGLVLVDDLAAGTADCKGSYLVYRKLEQDVKRFKIREQLLADELGLEGDDRERAGAMAVGRFEDGTPLALSQSDGFVPAKENNFTYKDDADGLKCPFHAHVRKTNPRGDIGRRTGNPGPGTDAQERSHRIARRAITYGERAKNINELQALDDLPSEGVGLLFMCFQASIANQFAFMQKQWVNTETFVNVNPPFPPPPGSNAAPTGVDPVIGQAPVGPDGRPTSRPQVWVENWGDTTNPPPAKAFSFGQFVKLKGGEFFFAPSIPFLSKLVPPPVQPPPPVPPPLPPGPLQPPYGG